jgi:molybdopterin converting factor subunit 1
MTVRILFFGRLRAQTGGTLELALPDDVRDTDGLRAWLSDDIPLDPSIRVAVNAELCHGNAPLADGDEIAFLPPMSGG